MTQPLGYFGPGPDGRGRGRSRWLLPGVVAVFAGFCLLAAVVPVHIGRQDVRAQVAGTDLALLSATVEAFEIDTGRYPTAAEGLAALVSRPAGVAAWRGPYLSFLKPDPWGRPYVYQPSDRAAAARGTASSRWGRTARKGPPTTFSRRPVRPPPQAPCPHHGLPSRRHEGPRYYTYDILGKSSTLALLRQNAFSAERRASGSAVKRRRV